MRAAKALIRHVRRMQDEGVKPTSRDLVGYAPIVPRGTCKWCNGKTEPRKNWHGPCVKAYACARGQVWMMPQRRGFKKCQICGNTEADTDYEVALEVDHRLSLALASYYEPRDWIRAWWYTNLRWLCHTCHVQKTRKDIFLINQCKKGNIVKYADVYDNPDFKLI